MNNAEIAAHLDELGDLYELDGAVIYRIVAYRTAAQAIRDCPASVDELARAGRLTELPGIGKTLEEKVVALLDTGEIPAAVKLKAKFPPGLLEIMHLPDFGPKRARRLFEELGVASVDDLKRAAEKQEIRELQGFGAKIEENLLAALKAGAHEAADERILLSKALAVAEPIVAALRAHPASDQVEIAGSARRMCDTCHDLDLIATASDSAALIDAFKALSEVAEVLASGKAGATVATHAGVQVDLRVVPPSHYGNLLQHFTGSKGHNVALREHAVKRGLHVSEHGVLDDATGKTHACTTEQEVYELIGLEYVEPELRENRGELEAAQAGRLPALIGYEDIAGELHCHTTLSDGRNTLEEMVAAARKRGYRYLAITDHSATHGFGNNVTAPQLKRRIAKVRKLDAKLGRFKLMIGSEVNIHPDGSLDYADELLAELDWVVASVHTSFRMDERQMTERIVLAMEHPYVDAIGHPTGRLILERDPYAVDAEQLIAAAARTGTMLEINANPRRRDLSETHARRAIEAGALLVIGTDAHSVDHLDFMRYGVATARRAWVGRHQVANTRNWRDFSRLRKRAKTRARSVS